MALLTKAQYVAEGLTAVCYARRTGAVVGWRRADIVGVVVLYMAGRVDSDASLTNDGLQGLGCEAGEASRGGLHAAASGVQRKSEGRASSF